MATLVQTSWLTQVLRVVPSRLLAALDAWSYRIALKRAEQRRRAESARQGRAAAVIAQYKLKPWRD